MKTILCKRCGEPIIAGKRRTCLRCEEEKRQAEAAAAREGYRGLPKLDDLDERIERYRKRAAGRKPLFGD